MWKIVAVSTLGTVLSGCSVLCAIPVVGTYEPECIKKQQTAPEFESQKQENQKP